MIKVNMVNDYKTIIACDSKGIRRYLKIYEKNNNLYVGPIQSMFDRAYVMRDTHRITFTSKLDTNQNELMHISKVIEKINEHPMYSYFTTDLLIKAITDSGYECNDLSLHPKVYSASLEMFVEYGFNSMNFCIDKKGDIWVHYKAYEEQKQYRSITKLLERKDLHEFKKFYHANHRFIRYADMSTKPDINCYALRSINISKLYNWLRDKHILHNVEYVADIYHATLNEIKFHPDASCDSYIKILSTESGDFIKSQYQKYNTI